MDTLLQYDVMSEKEHHNHKLARLLDHKLERLLDHTYKYPLAIVFGP